MEDNISLNLKYDFMNEDWKLKIVEGLRFMWFFGVNYGIFIF